MFPADTTALAQPTIHLLCTTPQVPPQLAMPLRTLRLALSVPVKPLLVLRHSLRTMPADLAALELQLEMGVALVGPACFPFFLELRCAGLWELRPSPGKPCLGLPWAYSLQQKEDVVSSKCAALT